MGLEGWNQCKLLWKHYLSSLKKKKKSLSGCFEWNYPIHQYSNHEIQLFSLINIKLVTVLQPASEDSTAKESLPSSLEACDNSHQPSGFTTTAKAALPVLPALHSHTDKVVRAPGLVMAAANHSVLQSGESLSQAQGLCATPQMWHQFSCYANPSTHSWPGIRF